LISLPWGCEGCLLGLEQSGHSGQQESHLNGGAQSAQSKVGGSGQHESHLAQVGQVGQVGQDGQIGSQSAVLADTVLSIQ